MVDAVGSVKQVVEVALMIKEAADTVHHNKKVCLQIKGRVNRLRAILSKLDDADAAKDPAIRDTLKDLKETLCRAYTLVAACREEKNIISLLFTAGKLSRQLREVNEDILAQMAVACFGSNVQTTIMLTKHFQDPSMDPEQMGLAFSFNEDADHVVRSPGSHSQQDTRLEASDETGGATGVEPSSIPKKWHASLPWFSIFTYSQLTHATKKFSCELGRGSGGVVYKGTLCDGRQVAVKRTSMHSARLKKNNGSFQDHIHGKARESVLPWTIRFLIVEGIAQGLLYLHEQCGLRIIHGDIKPMNILLDDGYIPKIGDLGISKGLSHFADEDGTVFVRGTMGFIAPDLLITGCSSAKTDVYSYGILLLETISGQSCSQADSYFNTLSAWAWHLWNKRKLAEFIDPRLAGGVADVSQKIVIKRCIQIALLCVESDPARRPTMSDVLHMLRDNKQKLPVPQRPACTDYGSNNYGSDDFVSYDSGSYDEKIA
ncbi:unnamed protein product [Alopecurus aequalis]